MGSRTQKAAKAGRVRIEGGGSRAGMGRNYDSSGKFKGSKVGESKVVEAAFWGRTPRRNRTQKGGENGAPNSNAPCLRAIEKDLVDWSSSLHRRCRKNSPRKLRGRDRERFPREGQDRRSLAMEGNMS